MSTWDTAIFNEETNVDFMDELASLDDDEVVEAVRDACLLAADDSASDDEVLNGQAAATVAAIWEGAPFSAGDIADSYPFLREAPAELDEALIDAAVAVLEAVDTEHDVDQFLEALA